jgi:hypothetical protein
MRNAPFPTHAGNFGQGQLAGRQVEVTLRAKPDEFTGSDDLKFLWHKQLVVSASVSAEVGPPRGFCFRYDLMSGLSSLVNARAAE